MFTKKEEAETAVVPAPAEFPKKGSNGSGTDEFYSVEARFMFNEPRQFGTLLLDQRWKTVPFERSVIGVPTGHYDLSGCRDRLGLLSYQAAQALRWWFLAQASAEFQHLCLETRIVKHKVVYTYAAEAVSAHCFIGSEDRSNHMPDWGKS